MPMEPPGGRPLRVAVDATPLLGHPTGVGAFCAGVLGGLAGRPDLAVSAFAVSWRRRRLVETLVPAGVAVRQRAMPARPLHRSWARSEQPPLEWFVGPADVVHGTNFVVPPTRRAARVMTVHDLTTVRFPELCDGPTLAYPHLIRRAMDRGAWVHTPSRFVADEVVELLGADPARVRAVHSGVPPLPPPDPGAAGRYLPAGTSRFVLAVGTAEPRKDLPGLVRAFDLLAADRPDLALLLAGPEGWGVDPLARAVERASARARVVRTGWVDDATLSGLLHSAEVLAYPSVYEGFGFPPLQAMAAGVPVVASRAGALPEVLGEAAELVPVDDPAALAASLAAVLDGPERRAELVALGRDRAGRFTWTACADGLAALYRDARDARGAGPG
ncbi:MAG TPA: glycosyltransferase family 1 protein [Acidimicrobiales bacterium]|jgi:glycosyltransferase involved in cell wall biosynthesis|nr:glycosyltransferase family 1 protein [Acidimicrobiales bacterium]